MNPVTDSLRADPEDWSCTAMYQTVTKEEHRRQLELAVFRYAELFCKRWHIGRQQTAADTDNVHGRSFIYRGLG